jgi:rhamnose utilization protein RhaD (predicted bifunctional aldolase and dehydrogenase)
MNGFIKISKYAGMREDLVQAGGGNSSVKIDSGQMFIKASGCQLADITEKTGYAVVNPQVIKDYFLGLDNLDAVTEEESKKILEKAFLKGSRPSIETFLHSITKKYTLHTHPIVVNAMTCRVGGMEKLKEMFPSALIVPYATPGVELAKEYFRVYQGISEKENELSNIIFLENHGLVVSADSAHRVIKKTELITKRIEKYLNCNYEPYHSGMDIWNFFPNKVIWKVSDENITRMFQKNRTFWNHAFCPDCVVFLGKKSLDLSNVIQEKDIETFIESYGVPTVVQYRKSLYLICDSVKKAMEVQSVLSFSAQVMEINEGIDCKFLNKAEQDFLLNWDAEKYRKHIEE